VVGRGTEIRELFRDVLTGLGCEVVACDQHDAALDTLKRRPAFAAFVDMQMPGSDGIRLLQEIREARPATHVVAMSDYRCDGTVEQALRLGCFVCMMKPIRALDILGVLEVLEAGVESLLLAA